MVFGFGLVQSRLLMTDYLLQTATKKCTIDRLLELKNTACDVTSEPWEDSGSFCNLTKQKVGCLVKFRPCLTFYELKELKKCLLEDLENGMSSYEDKQLLKSCSIYKELFVKWA